MVTRMSRRIWAFVMDRSPNWIRQIFYPYSGGMISSSFYYGVVRPWSGKSLVDAIDDMSKEVIPGYPFLGDAPKLKEHEN